MQCRLVLARNTEFPSMSNDIQHRPSWCPETGESTLEHGTLFSSCLPRVDTSADELSPTFIPKQGQGHRHVLFVDDEKPLVELWKALLEMGGYNVTACINSLEALEAFRAAPECYDVVVTDQAIPNLSGEALAREILQIRPGIPIFLSTELSHTMSEEKALNLGIRKFLMKPFLRQDLVLAIQEIMGEEADTKD